MPDHYGAPSEVTSGFEMYLAADPDPMCEAVFTDLAESEEEIYGPAIGLVHTTLTRRGLHDVERDVIPVKVKYRQEPPTEDMPADPADAGFCWSEDIVKTFRAAEEWFDRESVYDVDNRGDCKIIEHEVPYDVTLKETRGATIAVDYRVNEYSADDRLCRVRLVYGLPWQDPSEQHIAVTVLTEEMPENFDEVMGVVELAFRHDPVRDIPTCLLDDSH